MDNNIELDIDYVRNQFPSLKNKSINKWAFFENAGGSYVPINVIKHLKRFMVFSKVQPYADFQMSKEAGKKMDSSIKFFSEIINAKKNEIIIGGSTTMNIYVLSNALKHIIQKDDEIIVTNQDHEANIGAWRKLKDNGAKIKEWKINPKTAELEIEELKKIISKKTKIVAVTHCSNIVGSINNIKKISKIVHQNDALIVVDGVSYAPHGFPDVKELDVDFYTFSLYKTYGPHLGLLYGKYEILKNLPNQNHEFLNDQIPYTLNPGGPNHEELASLNGIYDYFMNLYSHHFVDQNKTIKEKIYCVNELIRLHEEKIANPLLEYIKNRKEFRLIGKDKIKNKKRAPTISFTHKNKSSREISVFLNDNYIATRNDNFYAWRCLKALGINLEDGVVRISLIHYNSKEEIKKLISVLDKI